MTNLTDTFLSHLQRCADEDGLKINVKKGDAPGNVVLSAPIADSDVSFKAAARNLAHVANKSGASITYLAIEDGADVGWADKTLCYCIEGGKPPSKPKYQPKSSTENATDDDNEESETE